MLDINFCIHPSSMPKIHRKISKIDMKARSVNTFAINKSGFPASITKEGGFGRPVDVAFGPDGALYILDLGIQDRSNLSVLVPNSGVIWKITRKPVN